MTDLIDIQKHSKTYVLAQKAPVENDWLSIADTVVSELSKTVIERDRTGGHAANEREILRNSGLLNLSIPTEFGGLGANWASIYQITRRIAQVDSALAHIFAFHHLQVGSIRLYGTPDQKKHFLRKTANENLFWGNTLNPLDRNTLALPQGDGGYIFHGSKSFCSGALGSDYITASAWHEETESLVVAAIPTTREGVTINDDWDAIGQRQTDSGTASFNQVSVSADEVLLFPGFEWTPSAHFRSNLAQLVLVNLYLGIAEGAFAEAKQYTLNHARPWFASDVNHSSDDPYIQKHYGELWTQLRAAQVLANHAANLVDEYVPKGLNISAEDRGNTAIAIAEAKVLAHKAALEISSRLFDIAGARAASRRFGFDRYWRNARTHTLHDPLDYKLRDLGRWALKGEYPTPTSYS